MRIQELDIGAYGCFIDRRFADLSDGLVVVCGLNEAGKSTLFSLLTTLMYGFDPPTDDFPYRPWHSDRRPEIHAILKLRDGKAAEVWRRLGRSPEALLTYEAGTMALGNGELPFVRHVGVELYSALYALTQANMRSLSNSQRRKIGAYLLSGLGSDPTRPVRQVVAELEGTAQVLWRADRPTGSLCAQLSEELRQTRSSRRRAAERDRELRNKARRLREVARRAGELESELARLNAQIRRSEELLPVKNRVDQIKGWLAALPDLAAVEALPDSPDVAWRSLCARAEDARTDIQEFERERAQQVKVQAAFTDDDAFILERADGVEAWATRISAHQAQGRELQELRRTEERLSEYAASTAQEVLTEPWRDEFAPAVMSVPLPELKARIAHFEEKRREADSRRWDAENVPAVPELKSVPAVPLLAMLFVGLLLFAGTINQYVIPFAAGMLLTLLGASGCAYNVYLIRQRRILEDEREALIGRLQEQGREAQAVLEEARQQVVSLLAGLSVAPQLLERPGLTLHSGVERLQSLTLALRETADRLQELQGPWEAAQRELGSLVEELGEHEPSAETLAVLERELAGARERKRDAAGAAERAAQINQALARARDELSAAERDSDEFLCRVCQAAGETLPPDEAIQRAAEMQARLRRVREAQRQLEDEYPNLLELMGEIQRLQSAGEQVEVLDREQVERARIARANLQKELEDLREEKGSLQAALDHGEAEASPGELDGAIDRLEEQLRDLCMRRDRLALLAAVLGEADRGLRERHQPDVLKRACAYVRKITGGHYQGVSLALDSKGEERLVVKTEAGEFQPAEFPLSGGTLDQVYMALRLAVVDHLDAGHEPLPLVLDEVLVNWDDRRFAAGAEVLADIARRRQVFVLTCHEEFARRLSGAAGASLVRLDSP